MAKPNYRFAKRQKEIAKKKKKEEKQKRRSSKSGDQPADSANPTPGVTGSAAEPSEDHDKAQS